MKVAQTPTVNKQTSKQVSKQASKQTNKPGKAHQANMLSNVLF